MFDLALSRRGRNSLPIGSIVCAGGLGRATFAATAPDVAGLRKGALYRIPTGEPFQRDIHRVGGYFDVAAGQAISRLDGDDTTVELVVNGGMTTDTNWGTHAEWSIAAGVATKVPGASGSIIQTFAGGVIVTGSTYRYRATVLNRTVGACTVRLTTGTDAIGTTNFSANGVRLGEVVALASNNGLRIFADSTYDGSFDDISLFLQTPTCAPQGIFDYLLELYDGTAALIAATDPQTVTIV